MPPVIAFYVSAHGYGHATRQAALLRELRFRRPDARLLARSQAPRWVLAPGGEASCRAVGIDPGLRQSDGFTIELEESLRRHERFLADWRPRVEREAAFLRGCGARLVVSDVAPLAFAAAARAGVPAVAVGNFTWDEILGAYPGPRWAAVAQAYRRAYGLAREYFRLPMHLEGAAFAKVTDCPLLCGVCPESRSQARRALGAAQDGRPLILASFGGLGCGALDVSQGDDLSEFLFAGFGPAPRGLRAAWLRLPERTPGVHLRAVAACDALVAKPGYGVLSEALAHGKPVLLLPREGFPETRPLVDGFLALGRGARLAAADFSLGRWGDGLRAVLTLAPKPAAPSSGASFLAARLLSC